LLLTGRLPKVADTITWEGWQLEIVDMAGRNIGKVLASPAVDASPVEPQKARSFP
jgi:putative hemolysin